MTNHNAARTWLANWFRGKGDLPAEPGLWETNYHLAVDLSVPLPGFVKRRAEARIVRTAISDFTRHVEAGI